MTFYEVHSVDSFGLISEVDDTKCPYSSLSPSNDDYEYTNNVLVMNWMMVHVYNIYPSDIILTTYFS